MPIFLLLLAADGSYHSWTRYVQATQCYVYDVLVQRGNNVFFFKGHALAGQRGQVIHSRICTYVRQNFAESVDRRKCLRYFDIFLRVTCCNTERNNCFFIIMRYVRD